MLFSAVAVSVMAVVASAGVPRADAARPGAAAGVDLVARADWLDLFVSVMHDVLWLMGGDAEGCDTSSPDKAMAGFRARFVQIGVPSGLPAEQAEALASAAARMDAVLQNTPANANENEVRLTRSMIAQLHAAPAQGSRSSP